MYVPTWSLDYGTETRLSQSLWNDNLHLSLDYLFDMVHLPMSHLLLWKYLPLSDIGK